MVVTPRPISVTVPSASRRPRSPGIAYWAPSIMKKVRSVFS